MNVSNTIYSGAVLLLGALILAMPGGAKASGIPEPSLTLYGKVFNKVNGTTTRLHWTDQPYKWHVNEGEEVFAVLDGTVDMHYRENGEERIVTLNAGDAFTFQSRAEHTFQVPLSAGPTKVLWVFSPALPDHGFDVQLLAREQARVRVGGIS